MITPVAIMLLLMATWNIDDYHLNSQYRLWKFQLYDLPKDSGLRYHFLHFDGTFIMSLNGISEQSLRWYFPDMKKFGQGKQYKKAYEIEMNHETGWHWLGGGLWAARIIDGKVYKVIMLKG
jgi:hypothetical protein